MQISIDRSGIAMIVIFCAAYITTRVMCAQLEDENVQLKAKCNVYEVSLKKFYKNNRDLRDIQIKALRMGLESCKDQMTEAAAKKLAEVVDLVEHGNSAVDSEVKYMSEGIPLLFGKNAETNWVAPKAKAASATQNSSM